MAELKIHSRKDSLPKGLLYPLKTSALAAAIQQRLVGDMHLSISFSRSQAYWKEQRDRIQEEGRYKLVNCTYHAASPPHLEVSTYPWFGEYRPQVVLAEVTAIPREVLPKGSPIHEVMAALVQDAIGVLAPRGLPVSFERLGPFCAWRLEVELDRAVQRIHAKLWVWGEGEYVLQTMERELMPEKEQGR